MIALVLPWPGATLLFPTLAAVAAVLGPLPQLLRNSAALRTHLRQTVDETPAGRIGSTRYDKGIESFMPISS